MKLSPAIKRIGAALLAAALLTALAAFGVLKRPDFTVSDLLYQSSGATDGEIIVIGMDERATDAFGPMPWPRHVIAEAIEYLNRDPERKPAAIGIDILFTSKSDDPEGDAALVEAARKGGNVVFASAGTFGSEVVVTGDEFYVDTKALLAWDQPYDELREVSYTGHINAMADPDSIIRHALLYVDVPKNGRVYSFSRILYDLYAEHMGMEASSLPKTDAKGFFYIPFTRTSRGYYQDWSVLDLVEGTVPTDRFANKVVLIGPYCAGMQDEYRTSIDHAAPMYGIEIQANLIDAFRAGFYPHEAGGILQLVLLFLISGFSFWWLWDRKVLFALIYWAALCAVYIGLCFGLYWLAGVVLHVLWIPLAVTLVFIASVALNYFRASMEKRRITDTFGRYVDPAILKELLVKGGAAEDLGGKTFNIAVLFVDIRGFTTMSESLDPPTVVEIINQYLTLTTECIMRHHGTLDKFVGDCTMAFWNAPLPQEDPVYLACCAAMDMVEGSKALGAQLLERFGRTVDFGVGVHYGPAVVGNIGAPKRMDYTAIGDTVNTASRLESNAPGSTIYISRVVADALGDRAKTTSLGGSIKLKGKAEGFEVLTLDSLEMEERK
ncbi:MAG: CHASE2 domain-containing protein [Oscillospiraceae bacterium]|nr:CHASE2 domain-containing protein [Oscillospiraceae bacterium]